MKLLWILCYFYLLLKTTESSSFYSLNDERLNSLDAGLSIYRNFSPKATNFVFSPISLRTIYSILYQSSMGKTKGAIEKLLFGHYVALDDGTYLQIQSKYFDSVLRTPSINSVNKIYLKTGYKLQAHFKQIVNKYHAHVEQINFNNTRNAANTINYWTGNTTHGLIRHAIDPHTITPRTTLILINALYFKANWRVPFRKSDVVPLTFHGERRHETHLTNFILSKGYYKISINPEKHKFQVLQIPYEPHANCSFWIILPDIGETIDSIQYHINSKTINQINQNFAMHYTKIQFPIFDIETKLDGKQISPEMFKYKEYNMLNRSPPLGLNLLKQEVHIRISTNGTEAAAVTHAHMGLRSARYSQKMLYFTANRPFLFAIMRLGMNEPLFFGHYVKPTKKVTHSVL